VAGNRIVAIGFVPGLRKLLEDQLIRATITNGRGLNGACDNPALQRLSLRCERRADERSIRAYGGDDNGVSQVVVCQFVIGDGHLHGAILVQLGALLPVPIRLPR
jgi:hypothetical protein